MKFLTIEDVCEMLSISRRTLERMRSSRFESKIDIQTSNLDGIARPLKKRVQFPEPDLYIGNSPRWEKDKLLKWLMENGKNL